MLSDEKLIIGLGNILLKDEGIGVRCVEYIKSKGLGKGIKIVDGATIGYDLLEEIKGFRKVVLVDAVDMGKEAGSISLLNKDKLGETGLYTTHNTPLKVFVDYLFSETGSDIFLIGIQPASLEFGKGLSDKVNKTVDCLADILS